MYYCWSYWRASVPSAACRCLTAPDDCVRAHSQESSCLFKQTDHSQNILYISVSQRDTCLLTNILNRLACMPYHWDVSVLIPSNTQYYPIVELRNGVLGVKRVLGYGKCFIVDYVTWTCPEPKSTGCPLATLEEFFLQPKQNGSL